MDAAVSNFEGFAEMEIRSLLWLDQVGNEVYAKAYRTWKERESLLTSRRDILWSQASSLRNEIYQLVGFYTVFQGVLLTAVAQSNLLHCHNWWSTFFLSLLASLVTMVGVVQKFTRILQVEETVQGVVFARQQRIDQIRRLLQKRGSFEFKTDTDKIMMVFSKTQLRLSKALVLATLVVFSGLFLAAIYRIVCHPGPDAF